MQTQADSLEIQIRGYTDRDRKVLTFSDELQDQKLERLSLKSRDKGEED